MSLASTSPAPPATAGPFTEAMIGLGSSIICTTSSRYASAGSPHSCCFSASGSLSAACISCTSMPAQNALPAPVRITARTRFSWCKSSSASCSCAEHRPRQRVPPVRPVEHDRAHRAGHLHVDRAAGHVHEPCSPCRCRL